MADVPRLVDRFEGLASHPRARDYLKRATARPAFVKAHADQIAHFRRRRDMSVELARALARIAVDAIEARYASGAAG